MNLSPLSVPESIPTGPIRDSSGPSAAALVCLHYAALLHRDAGGSDAEFASRAAEALADVRARTPTDSGGAK